MSRFKQASTAVAITLLVASCGLAAPVMAALAAVPPMMLPEKSKELIITVAPVTGEGGINFLCYALPINDTEYK